MEREILITNFKLNTGQLFMCLHVCGVTCSNALISSFGSFELFVVLLSPNVLMDPGNSFLKTRFWKTHLKQQTEHLFLFCFNINVKLKSLLSGKLVLRFVVVCN